MLLVEEEAGSLLSLLAAVRPTGELRASLGSKITREMH